jgi:diacylglycerol kinase (ATP)
MKMSEYNLAQSFRFAFSGIVYALGHERNLRIHFVAAAFVLYITRYYEFTRAEFILLLILLGFVITCEMFNTAMEKTVDLKQPDRDPLAKTAKDVAAGAVLTAGITAVCVAAVLFWDIPTFQLIIADIAAMPVPWIAAAILAALWVFVFPTFPKIKK